MSVQIGELVPRDTVTDATGSYELMSAFGVHTVTMGTRTFVYVAGLHDDGISAFELGADGSLTSIQNVLDNATLELNDVANFTSATVNGVTYLYANAEQDDGINVFQVGADGRLTSIQSLTDDAALELNGAEGRMTVTTVGDGTTQFLLATGDDDNGISVFQVGADGKLANTHNVTDTATLEMDNAMDVVAATIGSRTFVYVAGEDDNGLAAFELSATGRLTSIQNINDDTTTNLLGATGLAVVEVDSVTYLIASGCFDDGLSVFSVSSTGRLSNVFNINDNETRGLNGAQGITPFSLGGVTYLAVSGRDEGAVSIFQMNSGGVLTDVTAVFDDAGLALNGSRYNAFATMGDKSFLIATGFTESGVNVLEILPGDGTEPTDGPTDITVAGGTVQENATAGTLVATLGAVDPTPDETFQYGITGASGVFEIVGDEVRVAAGAVIDFETRSSYTVNLTVRDSANNTYSEQFVITVRDVAESTPIIGTTASETLTGTAGNDEIWGRAGNDTLRGLDGSDRLFGEAGNDTLDGGLRADAMAGGAGADTYIVDDADDSITEQFGDGTDTVRTSLGSYSLDTAANANVENLNYSGSGGFIGTGNALNNTLLGGTLNDTFHGRGGNDVFKAGNGADTLTGGGGADDFVYLAIANSKVGAGMDRILDFTRGEQDVIVVTNIDANTALAGNQSFVLNTDNSFSAGEIEQRIDGTSIILEFNVDADATVEMAIRLENMANTQGQVNLLAASDFEL